MSDLIAYKGALLQEAARYVALGFQVFLCKADKSPIEKGGFKTASGDLGKLDKMLARHPDGMLAIRTGIESGIFVIDLDIDITKGIDGTVWLKTARERGLPECPTVRTPRRGLHLYFKHPGGIVPCSAGKIAPGVDIRGDGGYVIAPPSRSPKGEYAWL